MELFAELDRSFKKRQAGDSSIKVQLIPGGAALEALVKVAFQVGGERAAPR